MVHTWVDPGGFVHVYRVSKAEIGARCTRHRPGPEVRILGQEHHWKPDPQLPSHSGLCAPAQVSCKCGREHRRKHHLLSAHPCKQLPLWPRGVHTGLDMERGPGRPRQCAFGCLGRKQGVLGAQRIGYKWEDRLCASQLFTPC